MVLVITKGRIKLFCTFVRYLIENHVVKLFTSNFHPMKQLFTIIIFCYLLGIPVFAQVAINEDGSSPHSSSMLDVKSTSKGLLPPRMTFEQRKAISNPAEGLMVICTNCSQSGGTTISIFLNGSWQNLYYTCEVPQPPTPGFHLADTTKITWNWSSVPIATGYRIGIDYDFNSATDVGTDTSFTETNLICNTNYYRYVMAYNDCGHNYPVMVSTSTSPCPAIYCGPGFTVNHLAGNVAPVNKTVTYSLISNIPGSDGNCWLDRNLGATNQAVSVNDTAEESAGWYWQFNRKQGFKNNGTTLIPAWTISNISESSDWIQANDPCSIEIDSSWRIPTNIEWMSMISMGGWTTWQGPWTSGLSLHAAGFLNNTDGSLVNRGIMGTYWSSTQTNSLTAAYLSFNSGSVWITDNVSKARGSSVRCIKTVGNGPVVPAVSTLAVSNILQTSATGGGMVTSEGGAGVTARGVCWSTTPNPTISDSYTTDGTGSGTFSSTLSSLTPSTLYHVRAYATNFVGTSYGNEVTFYSQNANFPIVTTSPVNNITSTSAFSGGNVISTGGDPTLINLGVCWKTSPNPTIADYHTPGGYGMGTGTFISMLNLLLTSTTYYVRAFATNSFGTAYGQEYNFTTLPGATCSATITVNHVAGLVAPVSKTATYDIVTNLPGEAAKCWISRNLGASQQATSVSDTTEASAGW